MKTHSPGSTCKDVGCAAKFNKTYAYARSCAVPATSRRVSRRGSRRRLVEKYCDLVVDIDVGAVAGHHVGVHRRSLVLLDAQRRPACPTNSHTKSKVQSHKRRSTPRCVSIRLGETSSTTTRWRDWSRR